MRRPALVGSLLWMVLLALPAGGALRRDPLTEAETDQLREAALEPQLKLKLLVKFAGQRLESAGQTAAAVEAYQAVLKKTGRRIPYEQAGESAQRLAK